MKNALMKIVISVSGLIASPVVSSAQQVVTGKIVDAETKLAIKDVDIRIKGTAITTKTNSMGYFQLTLDSLRDLIMTHAEYDTGFLMVTRELTRFQASLKKRQREIPRDSLIFSVVEEPPKFPGGWENLNKYLNKNLKYPSDAWRAGIEGKVHVEFVVDKDGTIPPDKIRVVKSLSPSCDAEAMRLVRQFPTWTPGYQNHKPIRARFVLPIRFRP